MPLAIITAFESSAGLPGAIAIEGRTVFDAAHGIDLPPQQHNVGYVVQQLALFSHLTAAENVAYGLVGWPRAAREHRVAELTALLSLQGLDQRLPHALSGGQQQRVGIARSLAVEPELWFLDEPFSALDPLIRREMQDEFIRLQDTLHKTIVFITHDFDEAIRLADRIAIMKDGRIE